MNAPAEHARGTRELPRGSSRVVPGFGGELIAPGDDRYDAARAVWNAAIDRRPSLIARAHSTADVAAVIRHARDRDIPLSVRGGGHSAAGLAVADGAVMLDQSPMKTVTVDPAARVAVATAGLTWAELDAATQGYGLAVTGGRRTSARMYWQAPAALGPGSKLPYRRLLSAATGEARTAGRARRGGTG